MSINSFILKSFTIIGLIIHYMIKIIFYIFVVAVVLGVIYGAYRIVKYFLLERWKNR